MTNDIKNGLTNEELGDIFCYLAKLSTMVSPADAKRYYNFTFDEAVTDLLYGLATFYSGESINKTIEEFKSDKFYGPMLNLVLKDIRNLIGE